MRNTLAAVLLFAMLLLSVGVTRAETEIVPFDRKPGEGYVINPRDQAANLAVCGSRCDDQDSSRRGYITNGGWRPIAERPEAKRIFIVYEYSYDYEHNPDASPKAQAICGSRCNAMSDNLKSYTTPMGWRLIKVQGVQSRTITLDGPDVRGECICRGDEYLVEPEYPDKL
jgi:hypothetical protein